jgi:hypothetical protein
MVKDILHNGGDAKQGQPPEEIRRFEATLEALMWVHDALRTWAPQSW